MPEGPAASGDYGLASLGLAPGDRVRFRRRAGGHWHEGVLTRREDDGSLGLRDDKGAARALPLDQVEVRVQGPGRVIRWEPVAERAARPEQLRLL